MHAPCLCMLATHIYYSRAAVDFSKAALRELLTRPAMKFCRTACRKSRVDAAIRSSSLCPPLLQHTPQCQHGTVLGLQHHAVKSCWHLQVCCQVQGRLHVTAVAL